MIKLRDRATLAGVSELRTIMKDILDETRTGPVILTRRNKPIGVILSYPEYQEMARLVELLEDSVLGREAADRIGRKGRKTVSLQEAEKKLGLK
jgi:prevent-host-death family protein